MGLTERSFLERMELMGLTESKVVTNMEWLCQNPDKMVKIMHYPYRAFANVPASLMSEIPGFGCIHPKGEIGCNECKMDWLKSPVEKQA